MTTRRVAPGQRGARVAAKRTRTGLEPLLDLLIVVLLLASVGLAVLFAWSRLRAEVAPPQPMTGPGVFADAQGKFKFGIDEGWEVRYEGKTTRIIHRTGELPSFTVETQPAEAMHLVMNWNCVTLPIAEVADVLAPPDTVSVYTSIPCARDSTKPVYGKLYYTLADGNLQLVTFSHLRGMLWVVARSDPFPPPWPEDLIEAMSQVVISAQ